MTSYSRAFAVALACVLLSLSCHRPAQNTNGVTSLTTTSVSAPRKSELGRLRIFQRAEKHESPNTVAPHGGETFFSVTSKESSQPLIAGRFPVRGVELRVPPGTYSIKTWYRAYEGAMEPGRPFGECSEDGVVVELGRVTSIVRVKESWTDCRFETGEAAWNLAIRPKGVPSAWWVRFQRDRPTDQDLSRQANRPYLEIAAPATLAAVYLDVGPNPRGEFDGLTISSSVAWRGEELRVCAMKTNACEDFDLVPHCEYSLSPSAFREGRPTMLTVEPTAVTTHGRACRILSPTLNTDQ